MLLLKPSAMAAIYSANLAGIGFASLKKIIREKALESKTTQIKIMRVPVITKPNDVVNLAQSTILVMLMLSLGFLLLKSFINYLDQGHQNIPLIALTLLVIMSLEMLDGRQSLNKPLTVCQEDIG
jgi:hypothetical protein